MGLRNLHSIGYVAETFSGSVTASDTDGGTYFNEDMITSSFYGVLNRNVPPGHTNRIKLFPAVEERHNPIDRTTNKRKSSGWDIFAFMLPNPQDLESTFKTLIGRHNSEIHSGGSFTGSFPQLLSSSARFNNSFGYDLDSLEGDINPGRSGTELVAPFFASNFIVNVAVQLVKDNAGAGYVPEFNFNGIGDLLPGQGYQIKMSSGIVPVEFNLPALTGSGNDTIASKYDLVLSLDKVRTTIDDGWNIIGFNRIAPIRARSFDHPIQQGYHMFLTNPDPLNWYDADFQLANVTYRSIESHDGGFAKEINHVPTSLPGAITINVDRTITGVGTSFLTDYGPEGVHGSNSNPKLKFDYDGVKYLVNVTESISDTEAKLYVIPTEPGLSAYPLTTEFYYKDQEVTNASITHLIEILKDHQGNAFMPEWNYNGIGDFVPGSGYQGKFNEAIEGFAFGTHSMEFKNSLLPKIDQ